jgi:2-oxoglutarate dehydrogenase complex dehydrogenase (E1) component-like enzyme
MNQAMNDKNTAEDNDLAHKYKDTIDLPQTEFPMRGNGPVREPEIQKIWEDQEVYKKSIELREKEGANDVAFVRLEQLYPFPQKQVDAILKKYAKASELIWVQEEPENSGAWRHVDHAMRKLNLTYVGRDEGASPATGFSKKHNEENEEIMRKIFSKVLVK